MTFYNKTHQNRYELADKPLSSGGEGAVYEVIGRPGLVAKIYHENKRSQKRYEKLSAMVSIPANTLPECAWPQELLFQDGVFCGFVMDRVTGIGNLVDFFVYENRSAYSWDRYIIAALNIAAAVNNIHDAGLIIGDLKPDNIIIDPSVGKVRFVDTDSYQVTGRDGTLYPCMVATPEYIPPELQNINFEANTNTAFFNRMTDNFSLAVIIFKVLMNGVHPFACFSPKRSVNNLEINIRNGWSPYFSETDLDRELRVTLRSPDMTVLSPELRELFRQAFVSGRLHPEQRPEASRWFYALSDFVNNKLTLCRTNNRHMYYSALISCPWCSLNEAMAGRQAEYMQLLNEKSSETPWKSSVSAQKRAAKAKQAAQNQQPYSPPPIRSRSQQTTQQIKHSAAQPQQTKPKQQQPMIGTSVRVLIVFVVIFLLTLFIYGNDITISHIAIGFFAWLFISGIIAVKEPKQKQAAAPPKQTQPRQKQSLGSLIIKKLLIYTSIILIALFLIGLIINNLDSV